MRKIYSVLLVFVLVSVTMNCSDESRKADWITEALSSIEQGNYPRIKAVCYWHEDWINNMWSTTDLRINSSAESLQAYQDGVSSDFFTSQFVLSQDSMKLIAPSAGAYHSAFPDFGNSEDSVSLYKIDEFEYLAGKGLVWVTFTDNWIDGIKFPADEVQLIWNDGHIPYVRMIPVSTYLYNAGGEDTVYSLQKIIDGQFDSQLRQWADDARDLAVPIMVCFGVEVNGDWFPWSGVWNGGDSTDGYGDPSLPDGPERFRDAFRHIVCLFSEQDVHNVTWVFHVNGGSFPDEDWNSISSYYPGDEYVDWIGISVYGPQTPKEARQYWETFTEIMDRCYPELASLSDTKPLAVLEFGVVE